MKTKCTPYSKKCPACKTEKTSDLFNKDKSKRDGLQTRCRECNKKEKKEYYLKNKEKTLKTQKEYRKNNQDKIKLRRTKYKVREKERRKTDIQYRLKRNIRGTLANIIYRRNVVKVSSCTKAVGCSLNYLIKHIERQFKPGMTWDNYGEWHIDHIRPLCSFDLTDIEQFKKAGHYTNLQPLWAEENLKKSGKWQLSKQTN